ncbi:MAG: DUF979 family protein, partial [Gemmatimonadota bacterium]|nr:DUF979 family protein [Gemmatimonadota bacterium]
MIGLGSVYLLMGLMLAGIALVNARDRADARRWNKLAFWGVWAITFLIGGRLSDFTVGCLVIVMVLVSSIGGLGGAGPESASREEREASARRWGNRLFVPALLIPAVTLAGNSVLGRITVHGSPLVDPKQVTVIALGLATVVSLAAGMVMLRAPGLPRWAAWWGAGAGEVLAQAWFRHGFAYAPFALYWAWVLAMSILLVAGRLTTQAAGP